VEIHGRLSAGVDGEGGGMGGKETKVAPKDWPTGHDVDRSGTQYKLTPQMAYKNIFFSPKNRSKCKYRGKSPQRPDLDVFGLPENESGIHLSPKNLDKAVAKLSILRVQHCSMAKITP
jgi:hypothetical protein